MIFYMTRFGMEVEYLWNYKEQSTANESWIQFTIKCNINRRDHLQMI